MKEHTSRKRHRRREVVYYFNEHDLSSVISDGAKATMSVGIQHFSSSHKAMAFYSNQSFGDPPATNFSNVSISFDDPHSAWCVLQVTGHDATANSVALKINGSLLCNDGS
jgi:hypothetical protein